MRIMLETCSKIVQRIALFICPQTGIITLIGEFTTAKAMAKFLDRLNTNGKLTKTILYNLNPCANEVIATMLGNFQDGSKGLF